MGGSAIVFAGGDPPPSRLVAPWTAEVEARRLAGALVVAADSGLHHAVALGVGVDLVVGDLDSVERDVLDAALAAGTRLDQHPADKDATDLELAIDAARAAGARRLLVVGGHGGRLDHLLGNVLLLSSPAWADLEIDALVGEARVAVVRDRRSVAGRPGELVTLLALGGPARAVHTRGLRWVLRGEDLTPGSTRGLSNEFVEDVAEISLESGVLAVVVPSGNRPDQPPGAASVNR